MLRMDENRNMAQNWNRADRTTDLHILLGSTSFSNTVSVVFGGKQFVDVILLKCTVMSRCDGIFNKVRCKHQSENILNNECNND